MKADDMPPAVELRPYTTREREFFLACIGRLEERIRDLEVNALRRSTKYPPAAGTIR